MNTSSVRPEPPVQSKVEGVEGSAPVQQPKHPVIELLARYKAIFNAAWVHRAELAGPARLADEVAFLPAALSLQETPVHPAPRRLAWGLMTLFVLPCSGRSSARWTSWPWHRDALS